MSNPYIESIVAATDPRNDGALDIFGEPITPASRAQVVIDAAAKLATLIDPSRNVIAICPDYTTAGE